MTRPPGLLESEFFGHVKGAFTGADRTKPGRFRAELYYRLGDFPIEIPPLRDRPARRQR